MNQGPYGYPQQQGYYQQPPPKKPVWPWIIVGIVGFFGACGMIGAVGKKDKGADGTATTAAATAPTAPAKPAAKHSDDDDESSSANDPVTPVTAAKLIADYDGNEIRGDNAWKGKTVEVTGVVESIDKGPFGGLYVVLGTGDQYNFHSVHVNLKKSEESKAASLNKGDKRTFRGKVQGYTIGSVSVRDAVLTK